MSWNVEAKNEQDMKYQGMRTEELKQCDLSQPLIFLFLRLSINNQTNHVCSQN